MGSVRMAIVGMNIGRPVGRAFAAEPRSEVVALCDLIEERMHAFATELPGPVKYYTDYAELCRDPDVDAIFVGTPNQWHVPVALEAVRHNKHVLVIKPLADALAPARQLVELAESAGVVNMMALVGRYNPSTRHVARLIAEGFFGDVYYGRARELRRSGIPDWGLGFIQKGGGALRDLGVHLLDGAWWAMGMPHPVSVTGVVGARFGPRGVGYWKFRPQPAEIAQQYEADDFAGGFIRFANGAGLQLESFWACHQPEDRQIELFGTEAGAQLFPLKIYRTMNNEPIDSTIEFPEGPNPWSQMAAHFVECILDGAVCGSPLRHGLIVQEMLEALIESGATGREIQLG